jgi:hypothetical protein
MQNLEVTNKSTNTKIAKEHIEQVFQQLIPNYQQTQQERYQLASWEESQNFTILGVIEIFTTDIRGYASQVINSDNLEAPQEISGNLDKLKIFDIPYFSNWYFYHEPNYPKIKHYIESLNYLRLLIIEYCKGN